MSWRYLNRSKTSESRCLEVVRAPVVTEKSARGSEHDQYTFRVAVDANKHEIRHAIERLFNVKVLAVNTLISKGKTVRFRGKPGRRPDWKKAVVRIRTGQSIDLSGAV